MKDSLLITEHSNVMRKAIQDAYKSFGKHSKANPFQTHFEKTYNCNVVKKYSVQHPAVYPRVDSTYWHEIKFKNDSELTMFLLRWA